LKDRLDFCWYYLLLIIYKIFLAYRAYFFNMLYFFYRNQKNLNPRDEIFVDSNDIKLYNIICEIKL
jgi:hypothetical protein